MNWGFANIVFLFLFSFYAEFSFSNETENSLSMTEKDSSRVYSLIKIAEKIMYSKPDSSITIFTDAYTKAKQNYLTRAEAECLSGLARAYWIKGDISNSMVYTQKAISMSEKNNFEVLIVKNTNLLGLLYMLDLKLDVAMEQFNKALLLENKIHDSTYLSRIIGNIGDIYLMKNDTLAAFTHYKKALKISTARRDTMNSSTNLLALGTIKMGQKKYADALEYLTKANNFAISVNDMQNKARCLTALCKLFYQKKDFDECEKYGRQAIETANTVSDLPSVIDASSILFQCFSGQNNFKEALNFYKISVAATDSMFNIEKQKEIMRLQSNFEIQNKQKEIEILSKDKKLAQLQAFWFGVGFLLLLLLGFVLYRSMRKERKAKKLLSEQKKEIEEYNHELNQQNAEILAQRDEIESQKNKIAQQQKDIIDSIEYASTIQRAILPSPKLLNNTVSDYFIFYNPRDIVSGDFYWFSLKNDFLLVAAADCTGHGVPGAFMSLLGISFLNEITDKKDYCSPNEILNELRNYILSTLQQGNYNTGTPESISVKDGMDIALVSLNLKTGILYFSGANNPIYVTSSHTSATLSANETMLHEIMGDSSPDSLTKKNLNLIEIKGDKQPIGLYIKMESFSVKEIQLQKGDCIYLFSDGIADQFGGQITDTGGKKFKTSRLKQLLIDNNQLPLQEQKQKLISEINMWKGSLEQIDDMLMIGLKY